MSNVETIDKLLRNEKNIRQVFERFSRYDESPNKYDKTGLGFNLDERFAAHSGITIRVDSWMGTYGNSGSSTQLDLNDEIFNRHLLKVLNDDFKNIMLKVADSIHNEGMALKEKAAKELEEQLATINNLQTA